jgi:hypothetical protein
MIETFVKKDQKVHKNNLHGSHLQVKLANLWETMWINIIDAI